MKLITIAFPYFTGRRNTIQNIACKKNKTKKNLATIIIITKVTLGSKFNKHPLPYQSCGTIFFAMVIINHVYTSQFGLLGTRLKSSTILWYNRCTVKRQRLQAIKCLKCFYSITCTEDFMPKDEVHASLQFTCIYHNDCNASVNNGLQRGHNWKAAGHDHPLQCTSRLLAVVHRM